MNKYLAFGIVAVLLIVGGRWYLNQSNAPSETAQVPTLQENTNTAAQPTQQPAQPAPAPAPKPETANWKTYGDSHFNMRYPVDYRFVFNLCIKDCASQSTEGSSGLYVEVEAEKEGGCYLNLCRVSVKNRQTFNGVTWDYLGLQSYGDVGVSRNFYAYRTVYGGYSYHVLFNKDVSTNEAVMQSFKFGSVQLSTIAFLSPKSGDVLKQGLWHQVKFNRAIGFWPDDMSGKLILVREDGSIVGEVMNDFREATVSIGVENAGTIDNLIKITSGRYKLRLVTNDSSQKLLAESAVFVVQE